MLSPRSTQRGCFPALALMAVMTPAAGLARQASFHGLGVLPPAASSTAHGVSFDGSTVVGDLGQWPTTSRAFRWTAAGGTEDLGLLAGGSAASAGAANADGSVVVGGCVAPGIRPIRWTNATGMQDLGLAPGYLHGFATGVSADGGTVTGWLSATNNNRAFIWTQAGGMTLLPLPTGWVSMTAHSLSADGAAVTGQANTGAAFPWRAFRWTPGTGTQSLGTLPQTAESSGVAISPDGAVVVGWSGSPFVGAFPVRWTQGVGMQPLTFPPGNAGAVATAVSDGGTMVAGYAQATFPGLPSAALLWTDTIGVVDLNVYLPTLGVNLDGWELTAAFGMSADGRTIVGHGMHEIAPGQSRTEAWIVRLGQECYPDCDHNAALTVADFTCFQAKFVASDPYADCDQNTQFTIADFVCFQIGFVAGCP